MTKTFQISAFLAAAAVTTGFALTSAAPAKASSLLDKCNGSSRAVVERCCSAWVQQNGRTEWMTETGATCGSSAACSSGGGKPGILTLAYVVPKKPRCYLQLPELSGGGSGPTPPKVYFAKPGIKG